MILTYASCMKMLFELRALALARLTPESCFFHLRLTDTSQNELGEICSLGHIFASITFKLVAGEVPGHIQTWTGFSY